VSTDHTILAVAVGFFVLCLVYNIWPSGVKSKLVSALPSIPGLVKNDLATLVEAAERKAKTEFYAKITAEVEEYLKARLTPAPKADAPVAAAPASTPAPAPSNPVPPSV
jgi:hypothetical protein